MGDCGERLCVIDLTESERERVCERERVRERKRGCLRLVRRGEERRGEERRG